MANVMRHVIIQVATSSSELPMLGQLTEALVRKTHPWPAMQSIYYKQILRMKEFIKKIKQDT